MIKRYRYAEKRTMNEHDMKILEMTLLICFLSIATFCGGLTFFQILQGNPSYEFGIIFFGCSSVLLIYYYICTRKCLALLISLLAIILTLLYLFWFF